MNEFEILKEIIESHDWDQLKNSFTFKDSTCNRLANALTQIQNPEKVGKMDLLGLLHNYINKAKLKHDCNFKVRLDEWFFELDPNLEITRNYHLLEILDENGCRYLTTTDWLNCMWIDDRKTFIEYYEHSLKETSAADFYENLDVRRPQTDYPVEYLTGYQNYNNEAQKIAVRNFFQLKPGEILLISLATGSGKSLLFHLAALINMNPGNMTIVVVPTVSLSLDHERSFKNLLHVRFNNEFNELNFAYFGALQEDKKKDIKYRIKNGEQPILFVSPESLLGSLLPSISIAAEKGFIRYFFIDEAHIITEWGNNFRPDFQFLPALLQNLKQRYTNRDEKFRTILLSATITKTTRDSLNKLFKEDGQESIPYLNGTDLRKEIVFWKNKFGNPDTKKQALFDLIKFLPRPILIYDTRPDQVENLLKDLQLKGYRRSASYHGKTNSSERENILAQWHENQLDIIVANTAFGLGVSKGNVRSVIHFCVPESLDRFYQEVGRTGRDGIISNSIMLYTDDDIADAERLNNPRYLTTELAIERWQALTAGVNLTQPEPQSIDLTRYPLRLPQQSDLNEMWNKRLLVLLARAELIEVNIKLPEILFEKDQKEDNSNFPEFLSKIYVKLNGGTFGNDNLRSISQFEAAREVDIQGANNQINQIKDLISNNHQKHYGEAFGEIYNITRDYWCCLSCPRCRTDNHRLERAVNTQIKPYAVNSDSESEFIYYYFNSAMEFSKKNHRHTIKIINYLIQKYSIREIYINNLPELDYKNILEILFTTNIQFFITSNPSEPDDILYDQYCNRLSLVNNQEEFDRMRTIERPNHVIIFPDTTRDTDNNNQFFIHGNQTVNNFNELIWKLP